MAHRPPRIAVIGSARVRTLAARLAGADARLHALAVDAGDDASFEDLQALLAAPGAHDDVLVTAFENDEAALSFFASDSARALRDWRGAMLDTSAITPRTLGKIVPGAPPRFCAAAFAHCCRDGHVSSVLYIERAALGMPTLIRVARLLADDVVALADAQKAKALAIVEGLLVGMNAAIVHEALSLAEASGVGRKAVIPLILKGSGATAVMALESSGAEIDGARVGDGSSARLARAFFAAREIEHPLLFASVATPSALARSAVGIARAAGRVMPTSAP